MALQCQADMGTIGQASLSVCMPALWPLPPLKEEILSGMVQQVCQPPSPPPAPATRYVTCILGIPVPAGMLAGG